MFLMVYQCLVLCAFYTPIDYKPATIVSISVNMLCMIITLFIYVGSVFDRWLRGRSQNVFLIMGFFECLTLNCTLVICYVNGIPDMLLANKITNLIYFSASVVMPLLLWYYVTSQNDSYIAGLSHRIVNIAFGIGCILLAINLFTGFIYYFDETGLYQRTDLFWVSFVMPVTIIAISIYWGFHSMKTGLEKFTIGVFILFTLIFGLIQVFNIDIQVMYIGVLFSMLAVYCNIYIMRGYDLAKKDVQLNAEKNAALVSQIRPHFLYNVLNTIMSMDDVNFMRKSIVMFGKYLRGNLDILSLESTVPFTKELNHVKTYIELEKIRYEDKLTIKYEISAIDFEIPPLCVQVLVENAIKHGISKREEGGIVVIKSYADEESYFVEVNDTGVGFDTSVPPSTERSHIGVDNARTRLANMVDGTLAVKSTIGVGTETKIMIPRKTLEHSQNYVEAVI